MKRGIITLMTMFLVITLPFVSAGIFDIFKKDPQLSPQEFSVTVGNVAPTITVISTINPIISAGGTDTVNLIFRIVDTNGNTDIDETTLAITLDFSGGGETTRAGTIVDCASQIIDANTKEYDCDVDIYYYDAAGAWDIDITADDQGGLTGQDNDDTFTVAQLKAVSLNSASISFGNVAPGQTDQPSTSPTTVTNEGNFNVPSLGLTVQSAALIGLTNALETIPADRFKSADETVGVVCTSGTELDGTAIAIPNFILSKGSTITPLPTRDIQHCLDDVPASLSSQVYSTTGTGGTSWDIAI